MSSSNKTTTNAQVSQTSAASTAAEQYWIPSFARCHYDDENNLSQVTCRCDTCRSKSVGGVELAYATVEYWLAGHGLNAWLDPLGSGFHVVAIKSCTEKFIQKVHPEEYANGVRFWMNFDKNCFDVREPKQTQKASSSERSAPEASASASAESLATAPKRPTLPPAPAVNPWSKGKKEHKQEHKADESATAELKKPRSKKEKKHLGPVKKGAWKKVETELAPNSKSIVFNLEPALNTSEPSVRVAPFDIHLEKPCRFGAECKHITHTETSKFVCPYNHYTTATIIRKGEPIPDTHCTYDKVTIVDGQPKWNMCKNKACNKDHGKDHVAYCKGFDAKNSGAAAMLAPQAMQVVYVLPNGQMMQGPPMMGPPMMGPPMMGPPMMGPPMMGPPMMGPPMMGPPMMPQFVPPRFHGKGKQNNRRPPPPNYAPPKPKPKQELTDAEFEAILETEQASADQEDAELSAIDEVSADQEDAELSAIDEEKKAEKKAWIMHPDTIWEDIEKFSCRGHKCGIITPEFCECPLPSDFEESESEDEDENAILSRATVVAASQ